MRTKPGDPFSQLVAGMLNDFGRVKSKAKAAKQNVLQRVEQIEPAIGVVAEPNFVEEAEHHDTLFPLAAKLNAIFRTGAGVIDPRGKLLLDGDGNSEVG